MAKSLKVELDKINKKMIFPNSFNDLVESTYKWTGIDKNINELSFQDPKTDFKVIDENTFQEFKKTVQGTGKLITFFNPRKEQNVFDNMLARDLQKDVFNQEISKELKPEEIENNQILDKIIDSKNMEIEALDEECLKQNLKEIVEKKKNLIKESLLNEIISKIKSQPKTQKIKKKPEAIHEGISCSNCNVCPIIGKRFKCIKCENYNLCEKCEEEKVHDIYHILLQIRNPINEEELSKMILNPPQYIVRNLNYSLSSTSFFIQHGNKEHKANLVLKNTGTENWFKGFKFICSKKSDIVGNTITIGTKTPPESNCNIELCFNIEGKPPGKYKSIWQMCKNQDLYFGPLTEIEITIW